MKTAELSEYYETLSNELVTNPEKLQAFVNQWSNGFYRYSFGNYCLAMSQKPDFSLLAGYKAWQTKHERIVNKGEKAIWIWAPSSFKVKGTKLDDNGTIVETEKIVPSFRPVPVFDVSQTDGKPVDFGHSDKIKSVKDYSVNDFMLVIEFFELELKRVTSLFSPMSNGSTDGKIIYLKPGVPEVAQCATLFHELAHCILKHCDTLKSNAIASRSIMELEAEAVSYVVCSYLGIKNELSALYISQWQNDKAGLKQCGARVIKTAEKIIKAIESNELSKDLPL